VRSIDRSFGTGIRCLGICGLGASGSPAVVSILLAKRYSRLGKRVLVVDARPKERTTSRLMAPEQDRGLADVLVERDGLGSRDVLHHPLGFDVLPAGSAASWKALERQPQIDGKLGDFVDAILDRYDLCQIDLAPASEIVLNSLEPSLSGTLLVIESGKHTLTEIQHRIAEHTVHTSPILGVILTDAPMPQLDLPHANPRARDGAPDRRYKVVRRSLVYAERKPQDPDSRMIKSPR
jgi:Mrp family chromosome partitioning ATPase